MEFRFDHVAQQVSDVAATARWFSETIPGCRVLYQDDTWAFLEVAGARLALVRQDQHPGHVAWRVGAADLEELATRLGCEIRQHRDGSRGFYVQTPGGSWVEIVSYPPDDPFQ